VDPPPVINASYSWNSTGCYNHAVYNADMPNCFLHDKTMQNVTGTNLAAEDAGTITCTVTVGGGTYTSGSFILRISGKLCDD